jgi:hypothetical protein
MMTTESLMLIPFLDGGRGFSSGSFGAEGATIGLRTGSPDLERRRKLREERRGAWESLLFADSRVELVGGDGGFGVGGGFCSIAIGEPFDKTILNN